MHPYGGISICPRCEKRVYAAEQIMGPGRMLYHKPCLACMSCNKRLDSLSLMEHDQEPYCKQCYNKNFGPQDLRQANLPHRDDFRGTLSPVRTNMTGSPVKSPLRNMSPTREEQDVEVRIERAKRGSVSRVESPSSFQGKVFSRKNEREIGRLDRLDLTSEGIEGNGRGISPVSKDINSEDVLSKDLGGSSGTSSITKADEARRSDGDERSSNDRSAVSRSQGIPRTIPLTPSHTARAAMENQLESDDFDTTSSPQVKESAPVSPSPWASSTNSSPLRPTMTGTRYGVGLLGSPTRAAFSLDGSNTGSPTSSPLRPAATGTRYGILGSPTKGIGTTALPASPLGAGISLGGGTPLCAKCQKPVYFAEQVKASGRTFHRPCLRCTDCNTSLDSSRLAEKGDRIVCRNCYSKNYGPQGSGYALLGKAGA